MVEIIEQCRHKWERYLLGIDSEEQANITAWVMEQEIKRARAIRDTPDEIKGIQLKVLMPVCRRVIESWINRSAVDQLADLSKDRVHDEMIRLLAHAVKECAKLGFPHTEDTTTDYESEPFMRDLAQRIVIHLQSYKAIVA